jgi:hypothetical protein
MAIIHFSIYVDRHFNAMSAPVGVCTRTSTLESTGRSGPRTDDLYQGALGE